MQKLQFISQGNSSAEQEASVMAALDHGADWVQLRWKQGSELELFQLAEKLRTATYKYGARLIINDKIQLAKIVDADGVHLGLNDEPVFLARKVLGKEKLIGGTANTLNDILQRVDEGCDYIGLGPYRFTRSKEKLSPVLGLGGYRTILGELKLREIPYPPIFAIGGIELDDMDELMETGIYGVAVSKAIYDTPEKISAFKNRLQ